MVKDILNNKNLYQTFVRTVFWGSRLGTQTSIKRACKIILDYQHENIAITMELLKILNIYERIYLKKAKIMYKISNSLTSQYINEMFYLRPLNDTLQSLRSSGTINYVLPKPNKELVKQGLIYSGPMIWNNLPDKCKHLETIDSFHKN